MSTNAWAVKKVDTSLTKKIHKSKPPRRSKLPYMGTSTMVLLSEKSGRAPRPNMSRRLPFENILVAFPHFDKCDSLLYFPSSFARHLNSSDMNALTRLVTSHISKDCFISMQHYFEESMSLKMFVDFHRMFDDMQPDRISCVYSTKVINNQIFASMHCKYTDNKILYDCAVRSDKDPRILRVLPANRKEYAKIKIGTMQATEEEKERNMALIEAGVDLIMHVRIDMVLTFDNYSKKIVKMHFSGQTTSVQPVDIAPAIEI